MNYTMRSFFFFFTGIVVGSLEILGNPTGLIRNIGNGVADLFKLPFTGLTKGPGAFLAGVSQGMSSLLRNVTAGEFFCFVLFFFLVYC